MRDGQTMILPPPPELVLGAHAICLSGLQGLESDYDSHNCRIGAIVSGSLVNEVIKSFRLLLLKS